MLRRWTLPLLGLALAACSGLERYVGDYLGTTPPQPFRFIYSPNGEVQIGRAHV